MFDPFARGQIADFFVHFANNAVQIAFARFAMTSEERYLARVQDARNIVTALKQIARLGIDNDCDGDLASWHHGSLGSWFAATQQDNHKVAASSSVTSFRPFGNGIGSSNSRDQGILLAAQHSPNRGKRGD
jgi:hypothetical protein